jgi:predicted  nucleic acid-binding Zn-ribbon protein
MVNEIIKHLNSIGEVNLSAQKVELALGDNLNKLISNVEKLLGDTNSELNDAFTPIRQIEKLTEKIPTSITSFKTYTSALMDLESEYASVKKKIQDIENELGLKVTQPKIMTDTSSKLQRFQKEEENFRGEINEFNKLQKKYK